MSEDQLRQEALQALLRELNLQAGPFSPYGYTWGKMCEPERPTWGGGLSNDGILRLYPALSPDQERGQPTELSETEEITELQYSARDNPSTLNDSSGTGSQPYDGFSEMMVQTATNVFGTEYLAHRPSALDIDSFAKVVASTRGTLAPGSSAQAIKFGDNSLTLSPADDLGSSSQLCGKCQDFAPRQKFRLFGSEARIYARDATQSVWGLRDLQENQSKCAFCKLIVITLGLSETLQKTKDPNAKVCATLTPMMHEGLEWSGGFQGICLALIADDLGEAPGQHCICPFPGVIEPLTDATTHGWWRREAHTISLEDLPRRVDPADLQSMLYLCQMKDYQCIPQSEEVPGLRVVDVQEGCVVDAPQDCHYVSLSYVWGGVKQMRLTSETRNLLTTPGSITAESAFLSNVVRDSLYLCDLMQERYLWVDTLCILQDDAHDLATQISYMDAVYLRAKFAIVAAAGSNCEVGLPGVRTDRIPQPTLATGTVDGIHMVGTHLRREELFSTSTWNTRGWTLQEQVFSRKAFIFTASHVFFVCGQRIIREDCVFEPSANIRKMSPVILWDWTARTEQEETEPKHLFSTKFPEDQMGTSAFALWKRLLVYYLKRNLTSNSDTINAFKGVLRALDTSLQGFRGAMPKKFFVRSLVWYGMYCRKDEADFPTWSWAAWKRPGPHSAIGFQEQNDCIQWTPTFTALDEWTSDPESNFREPETFGHSHSHDNFRGQENYKCSQNSATFNVNRDFKHEHFASMEVDKEDMERITKRLPPSQKISNIIFFHTSTVSLTIDRPDQSTELVTPSEEKHKQDMARYAIRSSTGTILDHIILDSAWRAKQPDKLDFIALFVHEDRYPPPFAMALTKMSEYIQRLKRESYHPGKYSSNDDCYAVVVMLVEWDRYGIARRIGIPEENAFYYKAWLAEEPEFKLVALG